MTPKKDTENTALGVQRGPRQDGVKIALNTQQPVAAKPTTPPPPKPPRKS